LQSVHPWIVRLFLLDVVRLSSRPKFRLIDYLCNVFIKRKKL
jgi:hypothetical protein